MAASNKPFFLNYWPQIPVAILNSADDSRCQTPNCGRWANAMQVVDGYIGELLEEMNKLGIADNTIVMVMGDNGPIWNFIKRSTKSFSGKPLIHSVNWPQATNRFF